MRGTTTGAPVFLCGMMGSGKSTVGRVLASRLGCPFIDLDQRIERMFGRSIPELFSARGEAGFREAESLALRGLVREPAFEAREAVVATGGGVVLDAEHRGLLQRRGRAVFLDVPVDVLVQRLCAPAARAQRPLLGGAEGNESDVAGRLRHQLEAVWSTRASLYAELEFRVPAQGSPEAVAEAVLSALDPASETGDTALRGGAPPHREP